MEQTPESPSADRSPEPTPRRAWSISKAEFDGLAVRSLSSLRPMLWICAGLGVVFASTLIAGMVVDHRGVGFVLFGAIGLVWCIGMPWWFLRTVRASTAVLPTIWETNGCVCPLCLARVDAAPCARHGIGIADQPLLLECWEASARQDAVASMRCMQALRQRKARGGFRSIVSPFQRSLAAGIDPTLSFRERMRASVPLLVAGALGTAMVLGCAAWFGVSLRPIIAGCWFLPLMVMLFLWTGPSFRLGRLRCASCGQLCANDQPTLCAECGADLTRPTATTRVVSDRKKSFAIQAVGCLPAVLIFAGFWIPGGLFGWLPLSVRAPFYRFGGPPVGLWNELQPGSMTQQEVDIAVDLLIALAAPGEQDQLFDFDFFSRARTAGKIASSKTEEAARTIVQASLQVDESGDTPVAIVRPAFGKMILGRGQTPRLVFGGISIDGGPWTAPAEWSLFLYDTVEFFRSKGPLPALPEDQLEFRVPLAGLAPGPHALRARCWIVLHEDPWVRFEPRFDEHGVIAPPFGATVYDLDLELPFVK